MGYARGTRWNDALIKEKVLEVKDALELDRMPTQSECKMYFNDSSLTNAISRRKKWYALADELGLPIKECETTFGKTHETIAKEALQAKGHQVRKMPQNFPYDLLVDDCVKVDVKASRLYHGKFGNFYSYNLGKDYATCDYYILFAYEDNGETRVMVVPSKSVIAQNQISVGENSSKYYQYENAWDLIKNTSDYWKTLS